MRWGLVAVLLVGCNSGQGVDIEIHSSDKALTSAELWLAYDYCHINSTTKCDSIVWPNAQQRVSGTVFTLGPDEKVFRTELVANGVAEIHLESIKDQNKPIAIGIVGYNGTDVVGAALLENVEIPLANQEHWQVELHAASPKPAEVATANPGTAPTTNAYVWDRQKSSTLADPTGYAGCLALQNWTGSTWDTFYFVPNSDTDCDGDPPDCNPYWYDAPVSSARCVTESQVVNNVCAVGSLSCRSETTEIKCADQQPPTGPVICVGSEICNACGDSTDLVTCMKSQIPTSTSATAIPIARCPVQATQDAACINSSTAQGWVAQFFIAGGPCAPSVTAGEIAVIRPLGMPLSAGAAVVPVGTGTGQVSVHASPINTTTTGCQVGLTYTGNGPPMGPLPIVLRVSYGPTREILVPVVLDFQAPTGGVCQTSTTPATCAELGPWPGVGGAGVDSMFSCTTGP